MNVFDFTARDLLGTERPLAEWRGQVLLIVNVASKCGLTPQYAGLEELYRRHRNVASSVLGFPVRPVRPPGAGRRGRDR